MYNYHHNDLNKTEKLFQSGITSQINIQILIPNLLKNGSIAKLSYEINMSFITKTFSNVNKQLINKMINKQLTSISKTF